MLDTIARYPFACGVLLGMIALLGIELVIGIELEGTQTEDLQMMREQLIRERALADRIAAPAPSAAAPIIFVNCPVCADNEPLKYDDTEMQMWQPIPVEAFVKMNENLYPKPKARSSTSAAPD